MKTLAIVPVPRSRALSQSTQMRGELMQLLEQHATTGLHARPIAAFNADFDRVRKAVARRRTLPLSVSRPQ